MNSKKIQGAQRKNTKGCNAPRRRYGNPKGKVKGNAKWGEKQNQLKLEIWSVHVGKASALCSKLMRHGFKGQAKVKPIPIKVKTKTN